MARTANHTVSGRPKRTRVEGRRGILTIPELAAKNPEFVFRWVNDENMGMRMQQMKEIGYEHVTYDELGGSVGEKSVESADAPGSIVSRPVGLNTVAFLMKIRKEYYDEDQLAKAEKIDAKEALMKREALEKHSDYGKYEVEQRKPRTVK